MNTINNCIEQVSWYTYGRVIKTMASNPQKCLSKEMYKTKFERNPIINTWNKKLA